MSGGPTDGELGWKLAAAVEDCTVLAPPSTHRRWQKRRLFAPPHALDSTTGFKQLTSASLYIGIDQHETEWGVQ